MGAIAAGCTAVIKPSELCPTVSNALADLFPKYLDSNAYAIVNGAVEETTKLLELRWEHIFYTGSNRVGRVVAAAAAKHVTPLTLELGGKCPVVIAPDANIELSAKRILYGKQANLGQVCGEFDDRISGPLTRPMCHFEDLRLSRLRSCAPPSARRDSCGLQESP